MDGTAQCRCRLSSDEPRVTKTSRTFRRLQPQIESKQRNGGTSAFPSSGELDAIIHLPLKRQEAVARAPARAGGGDARSCYSSNPESTACLNNHNIAGRTVALIFLLSTHFYLTVGLSANSFSPIEPRSSHLDPFKRS